jgi:hypothetical protein
MCHHYESAEAYRRAAERFREREAAEDEEEAAPTEPAVDVELDREFEERETSTPADDD